MPILNIDSYEANYQYFLKHKTEGYLRKNRRNTSCNDNYHSGAGNGVDLNRNYGYKWGLNEVGSSGDACDESYRGPSPFSEPETQAIKLLTESYPLISLAFNFHK